MKTILMFVLTHLRDTFLTGVCKTGQKCVLLTSLFSITNPMMSILVITIKNIIAI